MYTFFGLTPAYKVHVHEMILSVMYACNGFSFSDVYNMPVYLRKFYHSQLFEAKKSEKLEMDKALKKKNIINKPNLGSKFPR